MEFPDPRGGGLQRPPRSPSCVDSPDSRARRRHFVASDLVPLSQCEKRSAVPVFGGTLCYIDIISHKMLFYQLGWVILSLCFLVMAVLQNLIFEK